MWAARPAGLLRGPGLSRRARPPIAGRLDRSPAEVRVQLLQIESALDLASSYAFIHACQPEENGRGR